MGWHGQVYSVRHISSVVYLQQWLNWQYLVGFCKACLCRHHCTGSTQHPAFLPGMYTPSLRAPSTRGNPKRPFLATISSACHNCPSCSKTSPICTLFIFCRWDLKRHANRTLLHVQWECTSPQGRLTNAGVFTWFFQGVLFRNALVIKTDETRDKNKDYNIKINQMIYSTVIILIQNFNTAVIDTGTNGGMSGNPLQ